MTPDRMLFDVVRLDDSDIRLWGVLAYNARFKGYCTSTDEQLAATLDRSPQTIRRSLKRLQDAGYITRPKEQGGSRRIILHPDGDGQPVAGMGVQILG
jgi:DNA-binding Lrp family transcriptional regulator